MAMPTKIPFLNNSKNAPDQPQVRADSEYRLQSYMNQFGPEGKPQDPRHLGINGLGHIVNTKPGALMLNPEHRWEESQKIEEPEKPKELQEPNIYTDYEANAKEVLRLVPKMPPQKTNDVKNNDKETTN